MATDVIVVGPLAVNCCIISCPQTHQAAVVDPGDDAEKILRFLSSRTLKVSCILLTHGHFDHIGAAAELQRKTGAAIYAHREELPLIEAAADQAALFGLSAPAPFRVDVTVEEGDRISLGELEAAVLHTPGHSPGSVSYVMEKQVFVGDVLFSRSIGRTDLFGGDYELLLRSIREKLLVLPDETEVYSGHGPLTTIGREKKYNPFLP